MINIQRITRHGDDDPECEGDYYEVIIRLDGEDIAVFGDYYHDKGLEKSEGFIAALRHIYDAVDVEEIQVSDYKI